MSMINYYDTRTKIRKLYDRDTAYKGNLVESILQAKLNFNSIEQINVSIQDYSISVTLNKDNSDYQIKNSIISYINDRINEFIMNNIDELDISEEDKNKIMGGSSFTDYHVLGNSIKFLL